MTRQGITRHRRKESQDPGVDGRGRQLQEDDYQAQWGLPRASCGAGLWEIPSLCRVAGLPQHPGSELVLT